MDDVRIDEAESGAPEACRGPFPLQLPCADCQARRLRPACTPLPYHHVAHIRGGGHHFSYAFCRIDTFGTRLPSHCTHGYTLSPLLVSGPRATIHWCGQQSESATRVATIDDAAVIIVMRDAPAVVPVVTALPADLAAVLASL